MKSGKKYKKNALGFRGHLFWSFLLLVSYLFLLFLFKESSSYFHLSLLFPLVFFYGLLPDIDVRTSKAFHLVLIMSLLIILLGIIVQPLVALAATLFLLFLTLTHHRKHVHSWWFGLLLSLPLLFLGLDFFALSYGSYLLHLLLDFYF